MGIKIMFITCNSLFLPDFNWALRGFYLLSFFSKHLKENWEEKRYM